MLHELLHSELNFDAAPFHVAMTYVGLGDSNEALRWLEIDIEGLDPWVSAMNIDLIFDPIRTGPRFALLVQRAGLV